MRFAGDKSHVRRLTKAEATQRGIPPTRESYIVKKTYTDPYEGKVYREGQVISNRQGRNVQAQESGNYRSYSQYNRIWSPRARLTNKEVANRNAWVRRGAKATGKDPNALRTDPKVREAWTQLYAINKGDKSDKSPRGPLAKLLVALGLRDEDDTHDVGDTPKQESKK